MENNDVLSNLFYETSVTMMFNSKDSIKNSKDQFTWEYK